MKTITLNKLGLKGEIEKKKTFIKGQTKEIRNQNNKVQIEMYNILKIGIEWLN